MLQVTGFSCADFFANNLASSRRRPGWRFQFHTNFHINALFQKHEHFCIFIRYFCYTDALTQRRFHCQTKTVLPPYVFIRGYFYTNDFTHQRKLLHTVFYTQRPLHRNFFRHIFLHTLFDTKAFTHRSFRSFKRQKMLLMLAPLYTRPSRPAPEPFLEKIKPNCAKISHMFPETFPELY